MTTTGTTTTPDLMLIIAPDGTELLCRPGQSYAIAAYDCRKPAQIEDWALIRLSELGAPHARQQLHQVTEAAISAAEGELWQRIYLGAEGYTQEPRPVWTWRPQVDTLPELWQHDGHLWRPSLVEDTPTPVQGRGQVSCTRRCLELVPSSIRGGRRVVYTH